MGVVKLFLAGSAEEWGTEGYEKAEKCRVRMENDKGEATGTEEGGGRARSGELVGRTREKTELVCPFYVFPLVANYVAFE